MAKPRFPESDRTRDDQRVQSDPDIRGVDKGRRGRFDDVRTARRDLPERVEREMNRERGGK